jgi:3-methyladenine DNA glycosylase/8-oxoguanine DNA glycosylase
MTVRDRLVEASTCQQVRIGPPRERRRLRDHRLQRRCLLPAERAEEIISTAEALAQREAAMTEAVRAGKSVVEIMGATYELMLGQRA